MAAFLDKVDQQIAARVDERLAASTSRARPVAPGNRRALLKGFAAGVASSVAVVLLITGAHPGRHVYLLMLALMLAVGAGARWASRHWVVRRVALPQRPSAAAGDSRR